MKLSCKGKITIRYRNVRSGRGVGGVEFTRKLAQNSSAVISNLEEGSGGRSLKTERFEEPLVCLKSSHQRVQRRFTDGGGVVVEVGWGGDC